MTDCYYYNIVNETNNPILKNLELTVILVMEGSKRLKLNNFITNLAKKTIIQYNKGFKTCQKTCGSKKIDISWKDINYSNITALNRFKKNYNNILILEEDAEPYPKYITSSNLKEIDKHILNRDFTTLSLGSFSLLMPTENKHIRKSLYFVAPCQAIIHNLNNIDSSIDKVISDSCQGGPWDNYYLTKIINTNIFYKPLIVQRFPETENKKTSWDHSYLLDVVFKLADIENNINVWDYTYFFLDNLFIITLVIIILIIFFINYKK